jgi:hypothetical protein
VSAVIRAVGETGGLAALVCNAGIMRTGKIDELPLGDFELALRTNYIGTLYATLAAWPYLEAAGHARLGLVSMKTAGASSVLSATVFLSGGIIGTLHHLYFSGTPTFVLALGSVFSALEVVPLCFVGFDAWENLRLSRRKEWVQKYRWPIYFFVSVAFWNLVGAGLFGFMINPPIALYYMQGLNTTPVHGHAALFGVYGMLGIGLMLFALRALDPEAEWKDGLVRVGFWATNIGLFTMVTLSLLPHGMSVLRQDERELFLCSPSFEPESEQEMEERYAGCGA